MLDVEIQNHAFSPPVRFNINDRPAFAGDAGSGEFVVTYRFLSLTSGYWDIGCSW